MLFRSKQLRDPRKDGAEVEGHGRRLEHSRDRFVDGADDACTLHLRRHRLKIGKIDLRDTEEFLSLVAL